MPPTFLLIFLVVPMAAMAVLFAMIGAWQPLRRMFDRLGLDKRRVVWLYVPFLNVFYFRHLVREPWPNARSEGSDA